MTIENYCALSSELLTVVSDFTIRQLVCISRENTSLKVFFFFFFFFVSHKTCELVLQW